MVKGKSDKTEWISTRVSKPLKSEFEAIVKRKGMTFSEAARYAIRQWVEQQED